MDYALLKDLRLLIVEDELRLSQLLKETLSNYFSYTNIAKNGEEGIKKYHSFRPDVIITDITMPICDGLEMAEKIKQINKEIPIIVLSAYSEKEKLLKAIDININKYFIKPFDPQELIDYINSIAPNLRKKEIAYLKYGFHFDTNTLMLYNQDDDLINLTKREKNFISILIKNSDKIVSSEKIKKNLWHEEVSDERLRTFIKRLRIKTHKELIENISSQGYVISKIK